MEKTELIQRYIDYLLSASSPDAPVWNIENIRHGKKPAWNYIDGCMIMAVLELHKITGDKKYLDFADTFIDWYVFDDGTIRGYSVDEFNVDNINEGKVLFELYDKTGKEKYKLALDHIYTQVQTQPRIQAGNFWHKKIYPNQVWLDGLYMAQPFYLEYNTRYAGSSEYGDIYKQYAHVFETMRDPKTGLYYHGYDESRQMYWCDPKTGLSPNFWLRALGWFSMALVDVVEKADPTVKPEGLTAIKQAFAELCEALARYQDAQTGMWYQVVDQSSKKGNYLETSGSAILSFALLKAARLGIVSDSYREAGRRAFDGICETQLYEKDGHLNLGGICLMAGLGGATRRDGSFEYYISEPVVENEAKGVAPFLLAYTEIIR